MADKRNVVIAGGSSGIGRAAAHAFARRGDRVAVVARGKDSLGATERELRAISPHVRTFSADVTEVGALDEVADRVKEEWGSVDVWVNSAVVTVIGPFRDVTPADFDRVVDVVLGGTVNGTRSALRVMDGSGSIVQVGSAVAHHGVPFQVPYSAAKHAVHGFCDSLRAELVYAGSDVRVSEVNLPAVNTPLYTASKNLLPNKPRPFWPVYQPEPAAAAIVRAADTGARRIDVSSTATALAWADTLMPGVLDRVLGRIGLDLQQTPEPKEGPDEDYLYESLSGDYGTHGAYDDLARSRSYKELLRHHLAPERTAQVTDQTRRLVGAALARLAVKARIGPLR